VSRPAIIGERVVRDVVVRIGGLVHLRFPREAFRALQTWMESDRSFSIEITLEGAADPLLAEYDERWKWVGVIEALEAAL
jgi:hypothetical protein